MRRRLLPALLAVLAVGSAALALRPPDGLAEPVAAASTTPMPAPAAPVLSARRVPALLAGPVGDRRLAADLDALWASAPPDSSCLVVRDGARVLYERNAGTPLVPASALKLLTATAALEALGPGTRLRTTVRAAAAPSAGVVEGDLFLVGGGDPVLGTAAWAASIDRQPALHTPLDVLADRVVAAGVREVRGRVVGDDRRYDAERYVPSWPERYRTNVEIGPLSALTVNDGLAVYEPGRRPFPDPAAGAAGVFADLLRLRGVVVSGAPAAGVAPDGSELAAVESPPVAELVAAMLRESDNGTAELLVKELGVRVAGAGTTAAGTDAVSTTLADLGLPTDGTTIVDGSGLDRGNAVTCGLLAALLERVDGGRVEDGLAVAGRSGTLATRFAGSPAAGRLRAKTGSLSGVVALAGYCDDRQGELTFAFLLNGVGGLGEALPLQEDLAATMVGFPDVPPLEELGP